MAEQETLPKEKQVEKEDISTRILSKEEGTALVPSIPSYNRSFCRTWIQSSKFEHTWDIERFASLLKVMDVLISSPFPETAQYKIKITISNESDVSKSLLTFYILTETAYTGSCNIILKTPKSTIVNKSISGFISNETLLCEVTINAFEDTLTIHCNLEVFHQYISDTLNISHQLLHEALALKDAKSRDTTFDHITNFDDTEVITFIINKERYSVPKNLLHATNSRYFKNLCTLSTRKEGDMTDDVITNDNTSTFKIMLSYIRTGSISKPDHQTCRDLLKVAIKYDVQDLKMICEHYLLEGISVQNAVELIKLAFSCNAKYLEESVIRFIKFHIKEVQCSENFQRLSQEESNKIIELIEKSEMLEQYVQPFCATSRLVRYSQTIPDNNSKIQSGQLYYGTTRTVRRY